MMNVEAAVNRVWSADPRSANFVEEFTSFLISRGALDELAAHRAKKAQASTGERYDTVLQHLGLVSEAEMFRHLAEFFGVEILTTRPPALEPLFAELLDGGSLLAANALPISDDGGVLLLAVSDPFGADSARAIGFMVDRDVRIALMGQAELADGIKRLYGRDAERGGTGDVATGTELGDGERDARRLRDLASQAPVIRLVNDLIDRAARQRASDIHIEPRENDLIVRMRIDGVLHQTDAMSLSMASAITSRVKIMARLNIAERRLPQDGRIRTVVQGREIDLRVSTMPTVDGESVVLRLLDTAAIALDFDVLGLNPEVRTAFQRCVSLPIGIVLVTGPTGSGKTTTLYTALHGIDRKRTKVLTAEDPVEYRLEDVNQIQVQPKIGLTFASILRAALRQDPDIVMVGEIRDLETARMAVQASLTGHLVLSTVHTNSSVATLARLLDMGVERYLIASTLKAVLAQRLVRRLCPSCSQPGQASTALDESLSSAGLGALDRSMLRARDRAGCKDCRFTGFKGRTMIAELLTIGGEVERCLVAGGSATALAAAAAADGMRSMFADGLLKVLAGETILEEVLRVTERDR